MAKRYDDDDVDDWIVGGTIASLKHDGFDLSEYEPLLEAIRRADHVDLSNESPHFVRGYYARAVEMGRIDAATPAVDPADHSHRSARGASAAVKSASTTPDVDVMDLRALKACALSVGSFNAAIRPELAAKVLAALRRQGCERLADTYERAWSDPESGIGMPSDEEAERNAARSDADDAAALRRINRDAFDAPSTRTKNDAYGRTAAARRSK